MKNATEFANKFKTFRKKLPKEEIVQNEHGAIGEVIYSHLLWNATSKQADAAFKKMITASVDLNDLRMNHVFEMVKLIGSNYPQAEARTKRLKAVLNSIYGREHNVCIDSLEGAGKRDIREYFETLKGISTFVCNRVIAMSYEVAAIPVDDRTNNALIASGVVHEDSSISDTALWLARQVKADDVCEVHASIHAWVETQPVRAVSKSTTPKTSKKSPSKKKTSSKAVVKKKVTKKAVKKKVAKKKVAKKKVAKKKSTKKPASKKSAKKTKKKKVAKKKTTKKKTKK